VLNSCELIAASGSDLRFSDDDIARIMQAGARQPVISRRRGSGLRTALMSGRNDDFTMIVTIASTGRRCACVAEHGGSGHYVFLGPDGGPCRRSNYGRRVFARPATGGMKQHRAGPPAWSSPTPPSGLASPSPPGRRSSRARAPAPAPAPALPSATHRPAAGDPGHPGGHPARLLAPDPPGLTAHGLRQSHKTSSEDGIPEILAEQRLGHNRRL
jgi:hypothetical protein